MRKLGNRLTYANVVSTCALVLAVGGGGAAVAAALGENTVGSPQVIDGSLKKKDLGANSVTGAKIKDGTIGQTDLTNGNIGVVRGYAWINDGATALNTPVVLSNGYVYNLGGAVSVTRTATGVYNVAFSNLNLDGGNVQVSGYGGSSTYCNVSGWGSSSAGIVCFDPAGNPANTPFSLAMID